MDVCAFDYTNILSSAVLTRSFWQLVKDAFLLLISCLSSSHVFSFPTFFFRGVGGAFAILLTAFVVVLPNHRPLSFFSSPFYTSFEQGLTR